MKKLILAIATASLALTSSVVSAQYRDNDGRRWDRGDRDRGDRGDRWDRRDDRRDWRREQWRNSGWRDNRGRDWRAYGRYNRGQRFRGDGILVNDYRRYGWGAPPRGYGYYRTDSGDVVMAAIAGGLIASVIAAGR